MHKPHQDKKILCTNKFKSYQLISFKLGHVDIAIRSRLVYMVGKKLWSNEVVIIIWWLSCYAVYAIA